MCQYESIINGALDISDIAVMNELLDLRAENEFRAHEAAKKAK